MFRLRFLQRNYLITGVDDARVQSLSDLVAVINDKAKGQTVEVSLLLPRTRGDEILGYAQGTTRLKLR